MLYMYLMGFMPEQASSKVNLVSWRQENLTRRC